MGNVRIKEVLQSNGIKYRQLAEMMSSKLGLNTTEQQIKNLVRQENVTTSTLKNLEEATGIPMWHFIANPADVAGTSTDFMALISDGDKLLKFTSKQELKDYCNSDSFTGTVE